MENGCFQALDAATHTSAPGTKEAQEPPAFRGANPTGKAERVLSLSGLGTEGARFKGICLLGSDS